MTGGGVSLALLIGRTPAPAPAPFVDAIDSVEVTHSDEGTSGFQITFRVGRAGPGGQLDFPQVANARLEAFNRVILIVHFGSVRKVLMDGIITHHQLAPAAEPGDSTFTITGEDLSVMMDREERQTAHRSQSDRMIVTKILGRYARYGIVPDVKTPKGDHVPSPTERVPVQSGTDLEYLRLMARRHGFVFYVTPGPAPSQNKGYWGPPPLAGRPQDALTVGMGHLSNVDSIHFENQPLRPTLVTGWVQDRKTNKVSKVNVSGTNRKPVLARTTVLKSRPAEATKKLLHLDDREGLTLAQVRNRAQAATDLSMDQVVTATGELDAVRYGKLLQPRSVVALRGVGKTYDGLYYVKSVTHRVRPGSYKQSFTLTREGLASTISRVAS